MTRCVNTARGISGKARGNSGETGAGEVAGASQAPGDGRECCHWEPNELGGVVSRPAASADTRPCRLRRPVTAAVSTRGLRVDAVAVAPPTCSVGRQ